VFGEQVEAAVGFGWLDRLSADLEAEGYAVGSCVLGAHSAGADHQRQRLYWVADAECERRERPFKNHGLSCGKRSPQSIDCNHFAIARRAVVGDISGLRAYDGFRLKVARIELKGYGNAICVETAKLFIEAVEEVLDE